MFYHSFNLDIIIIYLLLYFLPCQGCIFMLELKKTNKNRGAFSFILKKPCGSWFAYFSLVVSVSFTKAAKCEGDGCCQINDNGVRERRNLLSFFIHMNVA